MAYPEKTVTTTLDPVGNRLSEVTTDASRAPTSAKTYVYDIRDRLLSIVDSVAPANNATFTWDANGNQTGKSAGGVEHGFLFDALDRLVEVQRNGLLLERYSFDPSGYRIRKAGPDGIFRYVRDDGAILQQTDDAGTTLVRYEWGGDRLVARHESSGGREYYLFDALGSPVALSQPDGSLSARYRWDAWGNLRSSLGTSTNPFGFTGYEKDENSGLYYAKARFYEPTLGRFLTEDPVNGFAERPPSLHRYSYGQANPAVFVDRDGRVVETLWDVASLGLGIYSLVQDVKSGNVGGAALDVLGIAADAVATAVPFLPGGAGAAIKASRGASKAIELLQTADRISSLGQGAAGALISLEEGNNAAAALQAGLTGLGAKGTVRAASKSAGFAADADKAVSHLVDEASKALPSKVETGGPRVAPEMAASELGEARGLRLAEGNKGDIVAAKADAPRSAPAKISAEQGLEPVLPASSGAPGKGESVYVHVDDAGNETYIGITDDLPRRAGEHRLDPTKTGTGMVPRTDPLTHDQARTIEAMKIRDRLAEARAKGLIDGTEPVQEQLQKAGLDNKNRGRDPSGWLDLDPDDYLRDMGGTAFDIRTPPLKDKP